MRIYYFITILFFVSSCQDEFDGVVWSYDGQSIVIEGMVTNEPGAYCVKIYEPALYNNNEILNVKYNYIANARVAIFYGNDSVLLKEKQKGHYFTDSALFIGVKGQSYQLIVRTSDGNIFESDICIMPEPAYVDSLYGVLDVKYDNEEDVYGNYNPVNGVSMRVNVPTNANIPFYYKFETVIVKQRILSSYVPIWYWSTIMLTHEPVLYSNTSSPIGLFGASIGFFELDYLNYDLTQIDELLSAGYVTYTKVYSLPKSVYHIFEQLGSQLNPPNTIFDPIPTRIESNITCTTNPTIKVLGYFGVASITNTYHFFYCSSSNAPLFQKSLIEGLIFNPPDGSFQFQVGCDTCPYEPPVWIRY